MSIKISFSINFNYKEQVTFPGKIVQGGVPEANELLVDFNGNSKRKAASNFLVIDSNFINLEISLTYRKRTLFTLQLRQSDFYELLSSSRKHMDYCVGLPCVYVTNFNKKVPFKRQLIEHETELANRVYFNVEKYSGDTLKLYDISVVFPKDLIYY